MGIDQARTVHRLWRKGVIVNARAAAVGRLLGFVRVDQAAGPQPRHDFGQAGIGDRKTALAATKYTGKADHFLTHVPGAMHHDRPGKRVAVGRVESLEPHRVAMGSDIEGSRSIGSRGGRVRARLVGEALQPSRTRGVGTSSMGNQMRSHAAIGKLEQVEPRCTRGEGEISDADNVSVGDAVVMPLQGIESALQQTGRYRAADTVNLRKRGLTAGSRRSYAS